MKKFYTIAFSLFSVLFFAQQTISFESNEGFTVGNINGQGAWISTPTGGIPENVELQSISAETATHGNASLKIVKEPVYGTQSEPIIGGFYNLTNQLASSNFSVSFDIRMSQLNGSDFGFQGVNSLTEQYAARVDFEKTGIIKILNTVSGAQNLVSTSGSWSSNTWYRFKVVGTAMDIKYYLNGVLIYTGEAVPQFKIDQLRFVHNNALGTAYIDNIVIDTGLVMAVNDFKTDNSIIRLHPNPASDFITINSPHRVEQIEIYDVTGNKMHFEWNRDVINVKHFIPGTYYVKVKSGEKSSTEKFIKK